MEWAIADEFPNYAVSEYGDVISIKENRRLKGSIDFDGYIAHKLQNLDGEKKHIAVHRLVAKAFLPAPENGETQVAHKNGSRLFSHPTNLKWVIPLENHEDRRRHGTGPVGEKNPKAKLTEEDVIKIRELYVAIKNKDIKMKIGDISKMYNLNVAYVCCIVSGKTWSHVPFIRKDALKGMS